MIIFLLLAKFNATAHPLHLSVTNIDIAGDSIKVAIRVFEDDFTAVVMAFNKVNKPVNLSDKSSEVDEYIYAYIQSGFKLSTDTDKVNLKYCKKEFDDLSVWIYLEGEISSAESHLIIENALLCNWFGDQKNIVIISYSGFEKGIEFSSTDTKKTITLVH